MKIRRLQLKNIGVFDDETIDFQEGPEGKAEIHIFTGKNGTGKTTLLMALVSRFEYFKRSNSVIPENSHPLPNNFQKRFREDSSVLIVSDYFSDKEHLVKTTLTKGSSHEFPIGWQEEQSPSDYWASSISKGKQYDGTIFRFAPFAYSGYRRLKDEKINLFDEFEENPLYQALDFIKDENSKFTVNQWLGRNLSKRALALEDKSEESEKFTKNIQNLEKAIAEIVGYEIRFKLKTDLSLVLFKDNQELDFDVLPDGLKSLISWIGDLLMRLDSLKWAKETPIFEREIILFLDEIEVHLHPAWQRKVLPVVQKLFKNSQIFISTHSPFVVNSIDDAWVYKLELENGRAKVGEVIKSEDAWSYSYVLSEIFDIDEEFGVGVQKDLDRFKELRNSIIKNKNGSKNSEHELVKLARSLAVQSEELNTIIQFELRQFNKRTGKNLTI